MTFKNKHFTKRDPECTNIVLAQADHMPTDGMDWEPVTDKDYLELTQLSVKRPMDHLYTMRGVRYYGWL